MLLLRRSRLTVDRLRRAECTMRHIIVVLMITVVAGCADKQPKGFFDKKAPPAAPASASAEAEALKTARFAARTKPGDALDPVIEGPTRVQIDVYRLSIPFGTV